MASVKTLRHQMRLAAEALHEADHLYRARYYASSVSHSYQTVLHAAAGLLYGIGFRPQTEREVRVAFAAQFVSPGFSAPKFDADFRAVETLRQRADFDHDAEVSEAESTRALAIAHAFHEEAARLERDVLKDRKEALK